MSNKLKIITTEDGSHSLYHEELQETYHSFHGAYRESIHVYMIYGLDSWLARNPRKYPIRVFELGFGTGLNAWLTLVWAEQNQVPVLYHTIEPFPVEKEIYSQLNYIEHDHGIWHFHKYFEALHTAPWNEGGPVSEYFNFKKDIVTLEEAQLYPSDVVFFDAFAQKKQPELWKKESLEKVTDAMRPGGLLTTYAVTGQLKRTLKELGLQAEILPGPPGKKEMTRAWKSSGQWAGDDR
ncbi:tRNA (5-methylaminomethyl-2-thiouridine)(34)-methyltransferase MnmD [Algoriphagus sp.]|jgi:tRNA U34 5-methylaminomethyl-2-thiouridine-forming methyltransferase MnmC|uniref:tRNA (5-methylaminomethyl-2-thiouridine)(34)-methyltransferase MnmD n=1 Tax=Algoriphagus sp. TaxID=1872435 RepID=UPI00271F3EA3|nr:tRNA (5-methylaminomethyl-2-thiouridine)(34)-methyltransferase MnmD [Algoriphagus sp.]MDO8965492.1 tRNA (5-methylaminomethyl-2-thiouridine)(34)-methyltransferase MnmD [Algoriphagus sp.]MDP3201532.1 tRNA (5-methylaminomethyl-2-thiouridine)(34)-methyltransferase MnmD [Algoriphagus sp.]